MSTDWMPGPRTEILAMCRNWLEYITTERQTAWGIPPADFTELGQSAIGGLPSEFAGRTAPVCITALFVARKL
jgi:hypothetical protein